jgi:hypothetical protein
LARSKINRPDGEDRRERRGYLERVRAFPAGRHRHNAAVREALPPASSTRR